MSNRRKLHEDPGLGDEISVVYPSLDPPHRSLDDRIPRAEFFRRMAGTGAAEQLAKAGRRVRVIALMDAEALERWYATRRTVEN